MARFVSKRLTPEGTQEFFGFLLVDSIPPLSLLYTSPQPRDWVNKDLLETDDGKWDATLMALWRRLQRHQNGADFWNESEIPEDEMYIFRAHFATALLASPLKHLNTKG